jgi:hypothetical protein
VRQEGPCALAKGFVCLLLQAAQAIDETDADLAQIEFSPSATLSQQLYERLCKPARYSFGSDTPLPTASCTADISHCEPLTEAPVDG